MCASSSRAGPAPRARARSRSARPRSRTRAPSASPFQPVDDQAAHALDQVRDRVRGRAPAEPVDLDQVAREVHRRDEQEDEEAAGTGPGPPRPSRCGAPRTTRARRSRARSAIASTSSTTHARRPGARAHADRVGRPRGRRPPGRAATQPTPASCPATSATPRIGVSDRRLRNPVWMSRARSVPAFIVANSAPCMNGTASAKATKRSVGKPGSVRRRLEAAGVHGQQREREDQRRDHVRRLAGLADDRAAGEVVDLVARCSLTRVARARGSALARPRPPAPSSVRPVFSRNTSSSEGACSWRFATCRSSASSARTISARSSSPWAQRTATLSGESWTSSPKRREDRRRRGRAARGRRAPTSTVGRPISAFSVGRRALGDDVAVVDDPDAVGEHIGLLQVLRGQEDGHALLLREPADLAPERVPALRVEPGGRLVEEEDARVVHERQREVEAALHPAGVACSPCGRRRAMRPTRSSSSSPRCARSCRGIPCSAVWRRRWSRPVSSGSSAASCSAAPIARRTSGPSLTTSKPADASPCRRSAAAAWSACARSSTCRRRSGRGSRRSRRVRRSGRSRRPRGRP